MFVESQPEPILMQDGAHGAFLHNATCIRGLEYVYCLVREGTNRVLCKMSIVFFTSNGSSYARWNRLCSNACTRKRLICCFDDGGVFVRSHNDFICKMGSTVDQFSYTRLLVVDCDTRGTNCGAGGGGWLKCDF